MNSDVDLMVIMRECDERTTRRMQRAHRSLGNLDMSKDVFAQARTELDRTVIGARPSILAIRRRI